MCLRLRFALLCGALAATAAPATAYVDHINSFSLGHVLRTSDTIVVLQVDKVNREKRLIHFKKVAELKGKVEGDAVNHELKDGFQAFELQLILDWAEPGRSAVCFITGQGCPVCIGDYWYECLARQAPWWRLNHGRGDMCFAYKGRTEKLAEAVKAVLAGKQAVVTAVKFTYRRDLIAANILRGKDFAMPLGGCAGAGS